MPLLSACASLSRAKPAPVATTRTVSPATNHCRLFRCVWRVLYDGSATTGQPMADRAAAERWVEEQAMSDCAS
jgi:hypothetical protein